MVAETEDFIFEYSMRREMITNHYVKEEEQENAYCKMRKQHLRDWPDWELKRKDMQRLCQNSKNNCSTSLPLIKSSETVYAKSK